MEVQALFSAIRRRERHALAQGITLVESTRSEDRIKADQLLSLVLPYAGNSFRLGISGIPGVGKSTLIEALGGELLRSNPQLQLACLTVDPSSPRNGGSILGDKIRMEELSRHPQAYIRSSPSGGYGGGTAATTQETLLLLEAAGFNLCVIETVGVGQSEIEVSTMVDALLLLLMPHTGDEIQSIKKGLQELAQFIVINKADGELREAAQLTQQRMLSAFKLLAFNGEPLPEVHLCSAQQGSGIENLGRNLIQFSKSQRQSGATAKLRVKQMQQWFAREVSNALSKRFFGEGDNQQRYLQWEAELVAGKLTAGAAARFLFAGHLPPA